MKGFLNFFARWVVPVLGLLALSLIIWFLGPLLRLGNYEPLASATSRWVLIVLLFLVWIGFRVLRIVQARRNAAKVMQSLAEVSAPDAASVATAEELATLKQRMDEALALLKRAKLGGSERRNLYELPWYVIIGPPGSGKTTALMNSGLDFPLAAQMGAGAIRGVGGTRNCDWWFTDEAVLLDTAGRYTTQDSHAQVDKAAWLGFLDLLKTQRKRRPIDGAFIAISLSDLLLGSDAERAAHAQAIRARIQELYQQLGVRFPIYVMLTKFDLVPGFMEFFDSLNREERAQVWGMTFALDDGKSAEGPLAVFDSEFALLEQRLTARLVERLQQERDPARRDLVYGFPQQFAALRECLGEFLNGVFKPNPYEERPLLRGLYFTSGTQEGSPIDRLIGSMAQSMNLDRQHLARQTGTGRSYFIERLFREVAFGERGLVGTNPKVERRRKWLTIGALSATALVVLAVTAVWIASYRANQSYIAAVDQRVDPLARGIESLSPAQRDVLAVLPQLNAVQNLAGDAPSWAEGYGLYQGDMLGEESASVYRKLLIAVFAPRLVTRIEEQLRSGGSSDFLYEGLKAYLMLGSPDHYDADFIKAWISLDWERNLPRDLSPEQRQALHAHLDALLERRPPSARLDQDLVEDLRRQLQQLPVAQRVYDRVKRQRLPKDVPDFRISDAAGRDAPLVFARKSGKPLTDPLSGFFTYRGYREVFLTASLSQAGTIAEEQWVLGRDLNDAGDAANLALDVRRLYFQDYLRQWDDLLADLTVVPITNVTQAADVLRILSGPTSPFRKLLEAVARETDLQKGDRLVAAQVKKAADGTVDKLKQRLGSLVGQEGRPRTAAAGRQRPDQRPLRRTQQPGQQGRGRQRAGADRQPAGRHERALRAGQRHGRSQRRLAARRRQEPGGRRRLARGPQRRAPAAGGPGPGEERGQLHHQQHDGQRAQPAQRGLDQRRGQRLPAIPGRALPDRRRQFARRHPGRLRPLLRCRRGDGQLLPPVPATLRRHLRQHLALAARRGAEARHQPRRAAHFPARGGDPRRLLPLRRHATDGALRAQAGDHGRGDQPVHPRPRRPAADLRPRPQPPGGDAVAERQRPRRGPPDGDAAAQQRPFRPDPGRPLGLVPPARPVGPGTRQLAGPLHPAAAHRRLQHRLRAARQQRLQPLQEPGRVRLQPPGAPLNSVGFYGKLAGRGDFVSRGLPNTFVEPWDAWLASGMRASQDELGAAWLDAYLTSPLWRFAIAPGLLGGEAVTGVVMPSIDRVGRYFPLTVACLLPANADLGGLVGGDDGWFEQVESLLLSTLEPEAEVEAFEQAVAQLPAPPCGPRIEQSLISGNLLRSEAVTPAQRLAALAQHACDGASHWWGRGSARISAGLMRYQGLPPAPAFGRFLTGEGEVIPLFPGIPG